MDPLALIQCAPNISEGRRPEVIEAVAHAAASCGVTILSVAPDADHNRTVITFAGPPAAVARAAVRCAEAAARLIDLNQHRGSYPRMGAVDVIPFVPISGCGVAECAALARQVGEAIGQQLGIPVYLYGEAATRPERRDLTRIRQVQFEGLRERVGQDPELAPDFGPEQLHPTAGCTAVGARMPRIAFHVRLGTGNTELARKIAGAVDASLGGLPGCTVLDVQPVGRTEVRIAMSLTDYQQTPLHEVFERLRSEAERHGVPLAGSELLGLVPMDALIRAACHYLQVEGFAPDQVLEKRLMG